jgi:hypothetical protein
LLALLFAILALAAGVETDPALRPAWDLLTTLRDYRDRPISAEYAEIAERGEILMDFGPTRQPTVAQLHRDQGWIIVSHRHRGEGPRLHAAILARAVSLHFTYDNVGRVHQTLGTTPAMRAGIADHMWSHEEIEGLLDRRPKS